MKAGGVPSKPAVASACAAGTTSSSSPASRKTGALTSFRSIARPSAVNWPRAIRFSRKIQLTISR